MDYEKEIKAMLVDVCNDFSKEKYARSSPGPAACAWARPWR